MFGRRCYNVARARLRSGLLRDRERGEREKEGEREKKKGRKEKIGRKKGKKKRRRKEGRKKERKGGKEEGRIAVDDDPRRRARASAWRLEETRRKRETVALRGVG